MPKQAAFSKSVRKWLDLFPIQTVWMSVDNISYRWPVVISSKMASKKEMGVYEYVYRILDSQYSLLIFFKHKFLYMKYNTELKKLHTYFVLNYLYYVLVKPYFNGLLTTSHAVALRIYFGSIKTLRSERQSSKGSLWLI